ncbi:hypothetical protein BGW36DRAFT_378571 [Talaromyces proteolyticus]|uniref:DOMON domain-containing protein n=1 Tax=Talaromyces proteolyticus TaxID=1131652 RepID=A0AAD4KSH6_9EURO|nr:uncharacterized protein BGW36DRAFT_378571 [Talaromyces proteolyticus]KAH8697377.1 hypothetical protein BGW36DRAFT_378571 [Talaromyces proteolyticus]
MRSGLQNPGAIPLLAMLVAALLSVTPIVCEAWTRQSVVFEWSDSVLDVNLWPSVSSAYSISLDANSNSTGRLLQSRSIETKNMQRISTIESIGNSNNIDEKETWWQRVYRISPLSSWSIFGSSPIQSSQRHLTNNEPRIADPLTQNLTPSSKDNSVNEVAFHSVVAKPSPPTSSLNKAIVDSSSPVDRNGSFLAVMVSLIVAILWF